MHKNPFILTLVRTVSSVLFVFLLGMLYWSSLLVEQDLKKVKNDLGDIKRELALKTLQPAPVAYAEKKRERIHIDAKLPNMLNEDPFYATVLPKLLGKDFQPYGIRKQASVGKPQSLHPLNNFADVAGWNRSCSVNVARNRIGFFEQYVPSAAIKLEERMGDKGLEYWVHLREGMFWQPLEQSWFPATIQLDSHFLTKHPLTAHDFKLYYDIAMNPFVTSPFAVQSRSAFADIIEVRVVDDLTLVVVWKTHPIVMPDGTTEMRPKYFARSIMMGLSPLAGFLYLYYPDGKKIVEEDQDPDVYRTNSTFAETFIEHWAKNIIPSCGPLKFKGMTDRMIKFDRNSDYFDPLAGLVEGVEIEFKSALENIWQEFKQGELDTYSMQPDQAMEFENFIKSPSYLAQKHRINRLDYIYRAYSYIGWNQARPLFKSNKVRRALTMGIDRTRIINQILNGMGIEMSAPFYPFSDSYDPSIKPWPYDPRAAKRMLEEEGFRDLDGDGIIEREDGLKFEFALTYYVKNPTTKAICEYVSTALKEIGVKCNLNGVDMADISNIFDDKNFDAYFLAWVLPDPPEDLRELWHSAGAKEKGSPNAIGFVNPEVDKIIEALSFEYDREKRIALYHQFARIFHEETPYTLLYTPKVAMLYRDYLQNVFLPVDRQDLMPGAVVAEPEPSIFWIKK